VDARQWLLDGRDGDNEHQQFAAALDRALAEAEASYLTIIARAARDGEGAGDWRAAAWWVEHRKANPEAAAPRRRKPENIDPYRLSSRLIDRFCAHVSEGMTQEDARKLCGINSASLYRWLHQGRAHEAEQITGTLQRELWDKLQVARLAAKSEAIRLVAKGGHADWRAAAWWLERRHSEEFGPRMKHDVTFDAANARDMVLGLLTRVFEDPRLSLSQDQLATVGVLLHEHLSEVVDAIDTGPATLELEAGAG